jgi:hypothetical protein
VSAEFRVADKGTLNQEYELEPLKAGEMHIRTGYNTNARQFQYFYVRAISDYTRDIARISDPIYLSPFYMRPEDAKWLSWRLIFENNIDVAGSAPPAIDTFAVSYRFQRVQ